MRNLFDTPPPPPDRRPFIRLAKIAPGHKYQFLVLTCRYASVSTHYREGETSVCLGSEEGCVLCADGANPRWSAFLAVSGLHDDKPFLLTITAGAFHNCPDLLATNGSLRGRIIVCERMGSRSNSPLKVQLQRSAQAESAAARLAEPDIRAALCRLWKLNIAAAKQMDGTQDDPAHKTDEVLKREMEAQDEPRPINVADFAGPVGQMF